MAKKHSSPRWAAERAVKRAREKCQKKAVYKTVADAETAARRHKQRLYHCNICHEFHLTSQTEGEKK